MPEGGEGFTGVLPEQVSEKDSQQTFHKCDWKNCKAKHREPPQYPGNGKVTRTSGALESSLDAKEQRPWKGGARNRPNRPVYVDQGTRIIIREQEAWEQEGRIKYYTEAHHLIPVELMSASKLTTLPHNAKLIGWNIDDAENGIFVPGFWEDIAIHGLQVHEGDHPDATYKTPIHSLLKHLEKQFEERCDGTEGTNDTSAQKVLASNLEIISKRARRKLLEIATNPVTCWKLHHDSVMKYNRSFARYLEVERRYQEQQQANRRVPLLPDGSSSS